MPTMVPETNSLVEYGVITVLSEIVKIYHGVSVEIFVPEAGKENFLASILPSIVEEAARHNVAVTVRYSHYSHTPVSLDAFIADRAGHLPMHQRTLFLTIITDKGTRDLVRAMNVFNLKAVTEVWDEAHASLFRIVMHEGQTLRQAILLTLAS